VFRVFLIFSPRFGFFFFFFLHQLLPLFTQSQFSFGIREDGDDENAMTVVEPLLDLKTAAGDF